ncbi:MAG: hypothetical protein H6736_04940 [Alphaproteobacteria bacterium]|nr:hypothetical protein [Alphaproteobacteria bacterium]
MLLTTLSTALALDCTGLDSDTCDAVNAIETSVNSAGTVLDEGSANLKLRPTTVYGQLDALRVALGDAGCTVDASFDGWSAGRGAGHAITGAWADLAGGADGGVVADARARRVVGTVDDGVDPLLAVGEGWGAYNGSGQFAVERGDGWVAGHWARVAGRHTVWMGLHGTCDVGVDVRAALDPWFLGDLPAAGITSHTSFVTLGPQTYAGLAAMDAKCQSDATTAGLPGTFLAAVTDLPNGVSVPSARFPADLEMRRPDGTLVASSVTAFFDLSVTDVTAAVQVLADGSNAAVAVMTGGGNGRGDCGVTAGFTNGSDSLPTWLGNPTATNTSRWQLAPAGCSIIPSVVNAGWYCLRSE